MISECKRGCRRGFAVVWAGCLALLVQGAEIEEVRDTLVYRDGDRLNGTLVAETEEVFVFKSDRFGELRVPVADAVVIKAADRPPDATVATNQEASAPAQKAATKPSAARIAAVATKAAPTGDSSKTAAAKATPKATPQKTAADIAAEREADRLTTWDRFSPSVLTARVRNFFGPWRGRLSFSTEVVSDAAERTNNSIEGRLRRKWKKGDVQLSARYDSAETNTVRTTDRLRTSGVLRYNFNRKLTAQYRPSGEWNRASRRKGVPNEYVLVQQELGIGYNLIMTPGRKLSVGVSENLFNVWNTAPTPHHNSRTRESAFEEIEVALPWRMTLVQRGILYPIGVKEIGVENRVELNKKLTETLSTSVRHELRQDHPDENVQDFTRLRLLFAIEF